MSWRSEAACAGKPTNWWFSAPTSPEHAQAKAICGLCPVRRECAAYATRNGLAGMWGGRNPRTRTCRYCSTEFPIPRNTRRAYCSDDCRKASQGRDGLTDTCTGRRYSGGCRCELCRAGEARRQAAYRARKKAS